MATRSSKPSPEASPQDEPRVLSASDRENPDKLTGSDLHALAHRRGLARSSLATMPDDKIRRELKFITYRQYDNAVE
jgi:hypothetical protein